MSLHASTILYFIVSGICTWKHHVEVKIYLFCHMTGVFLHPLTSVSHLIVLSVFRVSSGEVFRRTWSTRATERRTASSTKSPATAVNTAGCRSAWKWGCPKNVSNTSQILPKHTHIIISMPPSGYTSTHLC